MNYLDWTEAHLGKWGLDWHLPSFVIYTPFIWIQFRFYSSGGFDIELNNPNKISSFYGPIILAYLEFKPDLIVIDSEDVVYWYCPKRPIEWLWEIKDWLRPYFPFISR